MALGFINVGFTANTPFLIKKTSNNLSELTDNWPHLNVNGGTKEKMAPVSAKCQYLLL